jgi:hypothetical protein
MDKHYSYKSQKVVYWKRHKHVWGELTLLLGILDDEDQFAINSEYHLFIWLPLKEKIEAIQ